MRTDYTLILGRGPIHMRTKWPKFRFRWHLMCGQYDLIGFDHPSLCGWIWTDAKLWTVPDLLYSSLTTQGTL
jgi:hypothetical protein